MDSEALLLIEAVDTTNDGVASLASLSLPLLLSIGLIVTAAADGILSLSARILFDKRVSTAFLGPVIIVAVRNAKRKGAINVLPEILLQLGLFL